MVAYKATGEVARGEGISEAALQQYLRRHPNLVPRTTIAGRRVWTPEEIARLREARASGRRAGGAA